MSGCRFCAATAPSLNELHREHAKDGLVVIGVFHPKPKPRAVADDEARRAAAGLGFELPLAVDADWSVLRRWWLDGGARKYTSVSFLIDRHGVVRWIHPGGEYHRSADPAHARCDADYRELRGLVEKLLSER
jgi:peroxiredoxin